MPTVLLIEDDAEGRKRIGRLFARHDWNVLEADDGVEGMEIAFAQKPDAIICDLLLPKLSGLQVCRALREKLDSTKIIVIAGRHYDVDREAILDAGGDDYFVKPLKWEKLEKALKRKRRPARKLTPRQSRALKFQPPSTRLKFWGVRGSIPVPGPSTIGYGGNTTCVEVRTDGQIIILDAGSGIRELGLSLEKEFDGAPISLTLLLTHTHWDHIQGLPFFLPAYKAKNSLRVLGFEGARAGLATILAAQMEVPFFPVSWRDLPGTIKIQELKRMKFSIGSVKVHARFLNHPGICAGYRLFTKEGSIAFLPDNEPFEPLKLKLAARDGTHPHQARAQAAVARSKLVDFLKETDVLILDTQYTDEKYQEHVGWGHGALSRVVSLALEARVKKLFLFHHDPGHDDHKIDEMLERARLLVIESGRPLEVEAAREGAEVWLSGKAPKR
ncbi:MAG TPA: response regulator [Chthoniobacterales bacterium]|nr:response regulator [Chthoniobacterales bacterium]